jgi:prepilin-type N-terminal cleavage/methylation domain-containing protein
MTSKKAYTLTELIIVVGIITIIVLAAIPVFSRFFQMYRFRTTMDQVVNDIRAARQAAITRGAPVKITPVVLNQYGNVKTATSGYAIYVFSQSTITSTAATPSNWKEIVPSTVTPPSCGNRAFKPRFITFPVTLANGTSASTGGTSPGLLDIDKDGNWDLVFLPNGGLYQGPYPADGSGTPANLAFDESVSDRKNATPRLVLQTPRSTAFDRYCVSFSLAGKVTIIGYHS